MLTIVLLTLSLLTERDGFISKQHQLHERVLQLYANAGKNIYSQFDKQLSHFASFQESFS